MEKEKLGWMITSSTKNIGDDFQCIAIRDFFKGKDDLVLIEREKMSSYCGEKVKLFVNGWFMHEPSNWPPADNIKPLFTSMHISNTKQKNNKVPREYMLSKKNLPYMKKYSPIGCRDTFTYKLLKNRGIKSYFSGCMTLTLNSRRTKKGDYICLVDPKPELEEFIRSKTNREIKVIKPERGDWPVDYDKRLEEAEKLLEVYSNAHILITSRLHGALPALAMGTNVLLMEGKFGDERYEGLKYFLNFANYNDLISGKYPLDLENPRENPKEYLTIRNNLSKIATAFVNDTIEKIDFDKINEENIKALKTARKRTILFYKKYKLEPIRYREIKNKLRFLYRNIQNKVK